jgi:hypothetical protein
VKPYRLTSLALIAGLGGCASLAGPPVATLDPNPPPPRGYRVLCDSRPGLFNFIFDEFNTNCIPTLAPVERRAIRARG